ncbi:COG0436 Aspartate/tyrosine/aromatic aminotransferase [Candidatus Nanopelagicaceae bacterium]|jgi:succinyldiaminopimelate transaminase
MREKLPDFPWDALAPFSKIAQQHPKGAIDLSQGTPVDSTPQLIQSALQESSNSPRYPVTAGTKELQDAIRKWAINHLGASGDFDVLPLIGSKELVAWLPTILQSKKVIYPEVAYPTYLVGALIAQAKPIAVAVDAKSWPEADFAWVNTPSNPTGRVHSEEELRATVKWARENNSVLVCDECYIDFGDTTTPTSLLKYTDGDNSNILVVHSLSKRSSMAGYRGAFLIGDAKLISQIREIRKHAGMMVPLPIQNAMVAALSDESHVVEQRDRYNARRATLAPALTAAGFKIEESAAGLYIWCTRSEDCWKSVEWLANLGIVATPGSFYGELGSAHIRIAMTATDAQIREAADRIKEAI